MPDVVPRDPCSECHTAFCGEPPIVAEFGQALIQQSQGATMRPRRTLRRVGIVGPEPALVFRTGIVRRHLKVREDLWSETITIRRERHDRARTAGAGDGSRPATVEREAVPLAQCSIFPHPDVDDD